MLTSSYLSAAVLTLFVPTALASISKLPSQFTDKTYRIARQFATAPDAKNLLHKLVYEGVETEIENLDWDVVTLMGDGGKRPEKPLLREEYIPAMQEFISNDNSNDAKNHSLVYYIESLAPPTRRTNKAMIQEVVENTVLEEGGTVHLYLSGRDMSALGNHTDVTDIVVLQLDGEKEWLLCKEKAALRGNQGDGLLSKKLDTCSKYQEADFDHLDCERTVLYPGDALFLPRRIVHSARTASHSPFSAHLTFAFDESKVCQDMFQFQTERKLIECQRGESFRCITSCDICDDSCTCNEVCDESCDSSCDFWINRSCDGRCNSGCETVCNDCDAGCDRSCDTCDSHVFC